MLLKRFQRFTCVIFVHVLVLIALCTCTVPNASASTNVSSVKTEISEEALQELWDINVLVREKVSIYEKLAKEKKRLAEEQQAEEEQSEENSNQEEVEEFYWEGEILTPSGGVANGPSGFETYYNLPMGGVIQIMRDLGYDEESYPYWVRDDGCKMLGEYIMCAANLNVRPYGTVLPCSRGMAIVCDTGTFASENPYQLDIAVSW